MLKGGHFALGFTIGVIATILTFIILEMFATVLRPDSNLWAALVGALLGGGIALTGQILESEKQRKRFEDESLAGDLAQARVIFQVLLEILSTTRFVERHIVTGIKHAQNNDVELTALGVLPLSGVASLPILPMQSKLMLLARHENELYNAIENIDRYSSHLLEHFTVCQADRKSLLEILDEGKVVRGERFAAIAGQEDNVNARHAVLLNILVDLSRDLHLNNMRLVNCIQQCKSLIKRLGDTNFEFEFKENPVATI